MAFREDLVIPQGKSWVGPTWALLTPDGHPVDLTGRVVRAQVRASDRDAQVLHEWSTALGNVRVTEVQVELQNADGTTSTVTTVAIALAVKPTQSAAWAWRDGVYDVEITNANDPDDTWSVVELSAVRVTPEVTR